ncbi:GNAT family N-acetyltransferase [Synechococcus sp. MU1644]|nr:GNAT family N-acetyltransferase [Synechococcus sp. MU1644]
MADAHMSFPDQPTLTGPTLHLRPLQAEDNGALARAASDPAIWAVHPSPDRYKPEVFAPYFQMLLREGGTLVATDRASNDIIGCSRYYPAPESPSEYGIGFTFLTRAYWGGAANWEMKSLMLDHAFQYMEAVWFHIGTDNVRSQKATAKLGVDHVATETRTLSSGTAIYECYRLSKATWQARQASGSG